MAKRARLTAEEKEQVQAMTRSGFAAVVDMHLKMQKWRCDAENKKRSHDQRFNLFMNEHLDTIGQLRDGFNELEKGSFKQMALWVQGQPLGRWLLSIAGIAETTAAGILCHADPAEFVTVGKLWSFAGLNPEQKWVKGQKRPFNQRLKTILLGHVAECWKKTPYKRDSSGEEFLYVRLLRERKALEEQRNEEGLFADQAFERLARAKKEKWRISPEQRQTWGSGKLQAIGLELRAKRVAVKMLLSHYHQIGRELLGLPLVNPWVLEHGGHIDYIPPPCWPLPEEVKAERNGAHRKGKKLVTK